MKSKFQKFDLLRDHQLLALKLFLGILSFLAVLSSIRVLGGIEGNLSITEVDINPAINPGRLNNTGPFWTFGDLRATILALSPNGKSKVGWQDVNGQIHITPLKADNSRESGDIVLEGDLLYDLVSHDDGASLLILRSNRMYLLKLSESGEEIFNTELTDADDVTLTWHRGKLAWNGEQYAAYFAIHGTAGWTEGHEGDKLKFIDPNGVIGSGGWEWGCSHSMDVSILFTAGRDMPICISDCYPGKGVYLKNRYRLASADGNCAGTTTARFGQVVEFGSWMAMVYLSIELSGLPDRPQTCHRLTGYTNNTSLLDNIKFCSTLDDNLFYPPRICATYYSTARLRCLFGSFRQF
jgi:hypothetical protein